MDWVDKPQNYKDLYGILQTLRGSHLNNFPRKFLKLGWVACHSVTFQLKSLDFQLDFQSNQYKKLVPVFSRFCNCLFLLPEVERMIDDSLAYTVKAFGCFLPDDHPLYVTHRRSVRNISVCEILRELECYIFFFCGVEASELTSQLFHHVIPINEDPLQACEQGEQFPNKSFWRSKDCHLMCEMKSGKVHAHNVWSTWFPQERP